MVTYKKVVSDKEIELIHSIANVVFRNTYKEIISPQQMEYMLDMMYSIENLNRQITDGERYFIAYDNHEIVGYISIQPEGEHIFHLQKLYVMPQFQGMGYGKTLFLEAINKIKEADPKAKQMRLNVNRENKALDFYYRMGMVVAERGDFPIGNGYYMNDYIMSLDIA